jgi:hypothetical protein
MIVAMVAMWLLNISLLRRPRTHLSLATHVAQKWSKGKLKEKSNNLVLFDAVSNTHGS